MMVLYAAYGPVGQHNGVTNLCLGLTYMYLGPNTGPLDQDSIGHKVLTRW